MSLKAVGTFDFPLMQLFATLHDARYRQKYDGDIAEAKVLKKLAANTYLIYQRTKKIVVVSSRDLVLYHHVAKVQHPTLCPNGGVMILAFTPTPAQDQEVPITDSSVRAHCYLGGWLLEKISDT